MKTIKAIFKRPEDQYGEEIEIEARLPVIHDKIGGFVEAINFKGAIILCDEEGKLKNLAPNILLGYDSVFECVEFIQGPILVVGAEQVNGHPAKFADCPIDFEHWKRIVDMSGTEFAKQLYEK